MRIIYIILLALITSQGQILSPLLQNEMNKSILQKSTKSVYYLTVKGEGDYLKNMEENGFAVQSKIGKIATVAVPFNRINEFVQTEGLTKVVLAPTQKLHNSIAVTYQNVSTAYAKGYTGSNVIVGVIDTGIDFYNPMFFKSDGTTRILYIWDHTLSGTTPSGYTYGALFTESQINQDIAAASSYSYVPHIDEDGHGTHVAGSAAGYDFGNSSGTRYDGAAKDANLIVVKTDFESAHITDGVKFIFDMAESLGKPAVINMSLGGTVGAHDGTELNEQAISALTGEGKIIVRSAGNSGGDNIHYFADNVTTSTSLTFGYTRLVNLWLEAGDNVSSVSVSWSGGSVTNGTKNTVKTTDDISLYFYPVDSENGKIAIYVLMENESLNSNTFTLTLNGLSDANNNGTIERHVWAEDAVINNPYGGFSQGTKYGSGYSHYPYTLSNEACNPDVVAVGAFISRYYWSTEGGTYEYPESGAEGGIAQFSSIGPTADGSEKPDVVAGGTIILSARSANATYESAFLPPSPYTDNYAYMQGTSMASPVVTGAVALLLDKYPNWTPDNVKYYLQNYARGTTRDASLTDAEVKIKTDPNSWDRVFGYGAVDLTQAFEIDSIIDPDISPDKFQLGQNYPNPFNPQTKIEYYVPKTSLVKLVLFNSLGQKVKTLVNNIKTKDTYTYIFDKQNLASGVYYYSLEAGSEKLVRKMLIIN